MSGHHGATAAITREQLQAEALNRAGGRLDYLDATAFQPVWDTDTRRLAQTVREIGKRE